MSGFVTFKSIAEAHRIARAHQGPQKELHGARLALAPMPHDIVWQNISKEPGEIRSRNIFGFIFIGVVCFFYTVPVRTVHYHADESFLSFHCWPTWPVWPPTSVSWRVGEMRDSGEIGRYAAPRSR